MSQFLRPDADIDQDGDWERIPEDGAILWNVLDEASPNDADYIWHNSIAANDFFKIRFSDPPETPSSGAIGTITVRWRIGRLDGAQNINFLCYLLQGGSPKGDSGWRSLPDGIQPYEFTNDVEVTDFTDLSFYLTFSSTIGGGKGSDPACSWIQVEVTDAAGGVPPGWNRIEYTSEPPTPNAWNQVKREAGTGWRKLLYE